MGEDMTTDTDNQIELESEEEHAESPDVNRGEERKIFSSSSDPTIKDLYDRFKDGELRLQPDFQRQFVWDATRSSTTQQLTTSSSIGREARQSMRMLGSPTDIAIGAVPKAM
jgi:hypothetical protein